VTLTRDAPAGESASRVPPLSDGRRKNPIPTSSRAVVLALLGYAAAADAGSADEESLARSVCQDADSAEVGLPPAGSHVVGMADPVAVHGALPAYLTCARHIHLVFSIADLP
jgi:hypothetical protein